MPSYFSPSQARVSHAFVLRRCVDGPPRNAPGRVARTWQTPPEPRLQQYIPGTEYLRLPLAPLQSSSSLRHASHRCSSSSASLKRRQCSFALTFGPQQILQLHNSCSNQPSTHRPAGYMYSRYSHSSCHWKVSRSSLPLQPASGLLPPTRQPASITPRHSDGGPPELRLSAITVVFLRKAR